MQVIRVTLSAACLNRSDGLKCNFLLLDQGMSFHHGMSESCEEMLLAHIDFSIWLVRGRELQTAEPALAAGGVYFVLHIYSAGCKEHMIGN